MMLEYLEKSEFKQINKATEQLHLAVQFLAMAAKFFIPTKPDESHMNLGWLILKEQFITRPLGQNEEYALILHPEDLKIGILNKRNKLLDLIDLKGKKQDEILDWIRVKFKELGLNAEHYRLDFHYSLPKHADFKEKKFKNTPKKAFRAFSKLRTFADICLGAVVLNFTDRSEIRTWPHHFDHAALIKTEIDSEGKLSKSIGIGLAIHDSMINEPYFYISFWSEQKGQNLINLPALEFGDWLNSQFMGAILTLSEILELNTLEAQKAAVDQFFKSALKELVGRFKGQKN